MTRDDTMKLLQECGFGTLMDHPIMTENMMRFAALVAAAEREKVAAWMRSKSYATGHGDTIEDLLKELEWQVAEREREACAKVCFDMAQQHNDIRSAALEMASEYIRARGER